MVQTPSKPLTLEEFLKLPETKPASEYIDGKIVQKPELRQGQDDLIVVDGIELNLTVEQVFSWLKMKRE